MTAVQTWADESAFFSEDALRRRSDEVDLSATWRRLRSTGSWRLAWLRETGELYTCRNDSNVGTCSDVTVLAVVATEVELDELLVGWRELRHLEDGLDRLLERLQVAEAA